MIKIKYLLLTIFSICMLAACVDDSADNPAFGDQDVPCIYVNWAANMALKVGDTIHVNPQISPSDGATYKWLYDEQEISTEKNLSYIVKDFGEHVLKLEVDRNGVKNSRISDVLVVKPFVPKNAKKKSIAYLSTNGTVADVQWENITHLILTSSVMQSSGIPDFAYGGSSLNIATLVSTAHNYGVYIMLEYSGVISYLNAASVYGSYTFYDPAIASATRPKMITSMVNYALENGFDGINVYMDKAYDGVYKDPAALKTFFQELAASVPAETAIGKFHLSLSVVTGWTNASLSGVVNIPRYDWINVLAFGAEDLTPGPHSSFWMFTDQATQWMTTYGVAPERIVMSAPAFGLRYFGDQSKYTWGNLWEHTQYIGYRSICATYPDAPSKNKIDVDNGLYYDGLADVQQKAEYVVSTKLAGMSLWSIENDMKDPTKSLMKRIYTSLGN